MKNIKRIATVAVSVMLCFAFLLLAGCGTDELAVPKYNQPEEISTLKTTVVAENTRYSLIWNASKKRVILYDKLEDCEWSYVPQDALDTKYDADGLEKTNHPYLESPILIKCHNAQTLKDGTSLPIPASARSISKDACSLTKLDNGLEMMCYFPDYKFTIPVIFTLTDDGVDISVDLDRVEEDGTEYRITSITVAPLFCSVSNEDSGKDNHYLFMPSGSGTVIEPSMSPSAEDATYETITESVYGGDANVDVHTLFTPTESVRMPVFGAVNGDRAACAIITHGAEYANLNTTLGWKVTGYSYISPEFIVRGQQKTVQKLFTSAPREYTLYSDYLAPGMLTVSLKPLYNEDASYVGIAKKYREYLAETEAIKDTDSEKLLNLKIYGGIETKKFIFGIPSDDMLVATTLNKAQEMIAELKEATGVGINANLIGFGGNGNDVGTIAGDYKINSAFGKKKDMLSITDYCSSNDIGLFMNFDMIRFNSSGGGVSTTFDKAKSATGDFTTKAYYDLAFRTQSTTLPSHFLVTRAKFDEIAASIGEAASKWNLNGLSLDTLTSIVYSDFNDKAYFSGANFEKQALGIVKNYKEEGYSIAGSEANAYIAGYCDHIYDAPTKSSLYRAYSYDVPFYQIVFKGSVSMSGTSLNLATNGKTALLKAVESGSGLTYSLVGEYNTNLISSAQNVFYGSLYWSDTIEAGVKDDIIATVDEYEEFFNSVKGAKISDHKVITEKVRITTFDNGVKVYVNYGDTDATVDGVTVPALGYVPAK